mgnify:CR=1 FL=1
MGHTQSLSHMNLYAMSKITQMKSADVLKVIQVYLEDMEWEKAHPDGPGSDYDSDDTLETGQRNRGIKIPKGDPMPNIGLTEEEQEGDTVEFVDRTHPIHPDHLRDIMKFMNLDKGDINVMLDIYTTMDHKGTENVSIRDVLTAFAPLCTTSYEECIITCCTIFDLDDTGTVGYGVLLHVCRLIMEGIEFFGDKVLEYNHVKDVVNSIFTMEGKTEGFICYEDYMPFMIQHPVVVLFGSHQFQGLSRQKFIALNEYESKLHKLNERPKWRDQLLLKEHRIENGDDEESDEGSDNDESTTKKQTKKEKKEKKDGAKAPSGTPN